MAKYLKLATFNKYGEHSIKKFCETAGIRILNFKRDVFNLEYLYTMHIFAVTENRLGIQLILKSKSFDGDTATYYSTLCDMCKKYLMADIYPFYPIFITPSCNSLDTYPCTIINIGVDKILAECDEYPTEIKISAEIPDTISKDILKAIGGNILDSYYYLGVWLKQQCEKNIPKGCVVDV